MKFSIVTITYNSEKYLAQTVQSVLSQDWRDLEYIFVDGGSSDGTLDIVREAAAKDSRVVWISERDRGIADAMNKGIKLATGDVIAHLHSDDYYASPTVLSEVAAAFSTGDPSSLWVTAGLAIVDEAGTQLSEIRVRNYSYHRLIAGNIILHPATFLKREAFEKAGLFNISRRYSMDYDLWLRLGAISDPITVDRILACFRTHQGSLSTVEVDNAFDEEWKIRKEFFRNRPAKLAYHFLRYVINRRKNRNFLKGVLESGH